jgi:hypothetical protein
VKEDEAFNPIKIGLFGAVGIVLGAQGVADSFEQFFDFFWGGSRVGSWAFFLCFMLKYAQHFMLF